MNTFSNQKKRNKAKLAVFLSTTPDGKDTGLAVPFSGPCQKHKHTTIPIWVRPPALRVPSPGLELLGNLFSFF